MKFVDKEEEAEQRYAEEEKLFHFQASNFVNLLLKWMRLFFFFFFVSIDEVCVFTVLLETDLMKNRYLLTQNFKFGAKLLSHCLISYLGWAILCVQMVQSRPGQMGLWVW